MSQGNSYRPAWGRRFFRWSSCLPGVSCCYLRLAITTQDPQRFQRWISKLGGGTHTFTPCTRGGTGRSIYKASLGYTVNSRLVQANPVFKKGRKKKKKIHPSIPEAEAGQYLWGQPGLQIELQDNQDCYTEKPCLEALHSPKKDSQIFSRTKWKAGRQS